MNSPFTPIILTIALGWAILGSEAAFLLVAFIAIVNEALAAWSARP